MLHCCRLRFIVLNSVNRSLRRSSTYHIHCRMTTLCILSCYRMSFLYFEQSWIPNHQAIVSLLESIFSMLYVDQGLLILVLNQLRFKAPEMVLMNNFPWLNNLHEASSWLWRWDMPPSGSLWQSDNISKLSTITCLLPSWHCRPHRPSGQITKNCAGVPPVYTKSDTVLGRKTQICV